MAEILTEVTLGILAIAVVVLAVQVLRQMRTGQLSPTSFSTILLVVLIGWLTTEIISDIGGQILNTAGRVAHFLVMALFAITLTFQLRRSSRR